MFYQTINRLSNRPKPCHISVSVADEWLAEHGNGIERMRYKSKAILQAGKKKPPTKPWKKTKAHA